MCVTTILDPRGQFTNVKPEYLIAGCGLIPYFVYDAFEVAPSGSPEDIYTNMVSSYGFGDMRHEGGTVDSETGVYNYPEDPPMNPLLKIGSTMSDVVVYIYQYAIITVTDNTDTIVSRMD